MMAGTLAENDVHVWYCFCDDPVVVSQQARYRALLTPDEIARSERFAFAKDRHLFLVARALLRTTLSRYEAIDPAAWRFEWTAKGKPFLPSGSSTSSLKFNVSHSGQVAVCAIAIEHDVGVDVEAMTGRADPRVASHFLSPNELAQLHDAEDAARRELFYRYWTLKESYAKALGMGLSMRFTEFSFCLNESAQPTLCSGIAIQDRAASWHFHQQLLTPHYCLAVATQRPRDCRPDFTITCAPPQLDPWAGD